MINIQDNLGSALAKSNIGIPEDRSRLVTLTRDEIVRSEDIISDSLRKDQVALVQGLTPEEASGLMFSIAQEFGLSDSLNLQAALASSLGHRENVGKYYMSVNKREDYQIVCPHSEGGSFANLQLASFYCYENSTDGGETILMNTSQSTRLWQTLKEKVKRGQSTRELTPSEIRQAKVMLRLNMPEDTLKEDDEIISKTSINPVFSLYKVLAKPRKTYSQILQRELFAYWTTIETLDLDSLHEFHQFLVSQDMLRISPDGIPVEKLDDDAEFRIGHFGSKYDELFKSKITHKLKPGDFVIANNMTWTHAVNNWTPGSGVRKLVAAFA